MSERKKRPTLRISRAGNLVKTVRERFDVDIEFIARNKDSLCAVQWVIFTINPQQEQSDEDERVCRGMVREMMDSEDKGFSDGEIDFLESLHRRPQTYTPAQRGAIEKIYKRRM